MILSNDREGLLCTNEDQKPKTPNSNAVDRPESRGRTGAYYSENLPSFQIYAIFCDRKSGVDLEHLSHI